MRPFSLLIVRWLMSGLLAAAALGWPAAARAATPIAVDSALGHVELWDGVTALRDPTNSLTLPDVMTRKEAFVPPRVPYANFGLTRDTVWLRVPVVLPAGSPSRWWFTMEYAALDEVELFVQRGATTLHRVTMGDRLLMSERPFPSRVHAVPLDLPAGEPLTLFVRVRTTSTMIVPLALRTPATFAFEENAFHMWHGIAVGIGLCALIYALTGVIANRQWLYVWLAWSAVAAVLFFLAYFGLAQQYLWPENHWLMQNAAALLMMLILVGGFMFAEESLKVRAMYPRVGRAMHVLAGLVLALSALFVAGVIDYPAATAVSTLFGPWPLLLSAPAAVRRARRGDHAATWTIAGWFVYGLGIACVMSLNRGVAPARLVLQEVYLVCALLQVFTMVMIINVRVADLRDQAAATQREHDRVLLMSQTDPLTGLLNRRGLQLGLQPLVDQSVPGRLTAVYLLDLDGFKPVNDLHGHDAGDELLIQMGQRLKLAVRSNDLVARLGGDEFVVVASHLAGETEAELVGHKLLSCSDAPFELAHTECSVGITVGYALAARDGADGAELLRRADAAMYGGKQAGKRRVRRSTPEFVRT